MTPLEETQQALRELIANVTGLLGVNGMSPQLKQRIMSAHYILTLHQAPMNPNSRVQATRTYVLTLSHEEAESLLSRLNRRDLAGSPLVPVYDDLARAVYPASGATGLHVGPDA